MALEDPNWNKLCYYYTYFFLQGSYLSSSQRGTVRNSHTKEKTMSKKLHHNDPFDYQAIEARARALQGEETVRLFRASVRALSRAFRH